jgi:2-polyprenyl-3-methyl-5-hydroxy-6-metoxy-1,4-benzoquinol methylase
MSDELQKQKKYWNGEVENFDAIYSHNKGLMGNLMDRLVRWDMYKRFEFTMVNSEPIKDCTFLDVGCGTGRYSLEYARQGAQFVVGLDISENMVHTCNKRAGEMGFSDRTSFIVTDLMDYKPDREFDVCIGIGLFDYIKDSVRVIQKMGTCVRDKIIVSFPTVWTWKAPVRKVKLGLGDCDVFFYSRNDVSKIMVKAGFNDFSIAKIGQLYCVVASK